MFVYFLSVLVFGYVFENYHDFFSTMDVNMKKIVLKRVKSVPPSIEKHQQQLPVATQDTMASHDSQKSQYQKVRKIQQLSGTSTPIQMDVTASEASGSQHQSNVPCSLSGFQQTAMGMDVNAGCSSTASMTLTPSSQHNYSVSSLSSSHHMSDPKSFRQVVIPPSPNVTLYPITMHSYAQMGKTQNHAGLIGNSSGLTHNNTLSISSSSLLPSNANPKRKFVILSDELLSPPTSAQSPQTLRAKRIYNLTCQPSTSIANVPSLSSNIRNTKTVELKRTKIVPRLLTPSSSSSPLFNQGAVSSKTSFQLNSPLSSQTMRAHTILNLANSPSEGQVQIVSRSTALVNLSTASSSLSNLQLEVLLKKKEDQIKHLQRLNKNKTMQLKRKDKVIETLHQELDKSIDAILDKHLDDPLLSVVKDHIKNKCKSPQAHRFTNETKHFAQVIHFMSPKVLKILRQQFHICLPSESTISRLSCNWDFTNGFNPSLLRPLQMATKDLNGKEKVVVLTLDEMSIDTTIAYDKKNDKVLGLGSRFEEGFKMSKQALVFMVSFIFTICFSFS